MSLEEENQRLREQLAQRDERIQQQGLLIEQMQAQIEQMQTQMAALSQHVKDLQDRLAKDSHNSSLPPSSDRFGRQRKSLRKKSEKKSEFRPLITDDDTVQTFAQATSEIESKRHYQRL